MKRITLLLAFVSTIIGVKAQSETGTWSITPRVGVNSSVLTMGDITYLDTNGNTATSSVKHQWGLTAGVEVQYRFWIGVSMGIMYSNERTHFEECAGVDELKQSLHFLSVPLLANLYIAPEILPGLALKTGVQLGYLLQGKETLLGTSHTNTDMFHRFNFSIPAGISYEYRNIVADLRYNIGVSNLCNYKMLDETWFSNSLWLTLGYQFEL